MQEIVAGLYRWTARHPEAEDDPESESPADWPPDVGCVAYEAPDALVFVDPLVADWDELDALVARHGRPVVVLTTIRFHGRSGGEVLSRYGATRDEPPAGVQLVPIGGADETMVWLEEPRALIPGDRLIGDGRGGVRMCPESWLRYFEPRPTLEELRMALRPLLDLPVERVLVSHGEPVLSDGRAAIEAALSRT